MNISIIGNARSGSSVLLDVLASVIPGAVGLHQPQTTFRNHTRIPNFRFDPENQSLILQRLGIPHREYDKIVSDVSKPVNGKFATSPLFLSLYKKWAGLQMSALDCSIVEQVSDASTLVVKDVIRTDIKYCFQAEKTLYVFLLRRPDTYLSSRKKLRYGKKGKDYTPNTLHQYLLDWEHSVTLAKTLHRSSVPSIFLTTSQLFNNTEESLEKIFLTANISPEIKEGSFNWKYSGVQLPVMAGVSGQDKQIKGLAKTVVYKSANASSAIRRYNPVTNNLNAYELLETQKLLEHYTGYEQEYCNVSV